MNRIRSACEVSVICLALALIVSLSGCSEAAWRVAAESARQTVRSAAREALPSGGKLTEARASLVRALEDAPTGGLSEADLLVIKEGEIVAKYAEDSIQILGLADTLLGAIPSEATQLVYAALRRPIQRGSAFDTALDDLAVKALKGTVCSSANDLLSPAEQDEFAGMELQYDSVVSMQPGAIADDILAELTQLGFDPAEVEGAFDVVGFASSVVVSSNAHVSTMVGILQAPDFATSRAYLYYARMCVLPKK